MARSPKMPPERDQPGQPTTVVSIPKPDTVEAVAGHPLAAAGAGIVAFLASGTAPLAGLLPSLLDSLARGRQVQRFEQSLKELEAGLNTMHAQVRELSDDQFKVVAEAGSAMFSTVDPRKLDLLKTAALRAVMRPDVVEGVADALSRQLREMSSAEAAFLVRHVNAAGLFISNEEFADPEGTVRVKPGSDEEIAMSGLMSLGLIYARADTWDAQMFEWSPLAPKLAELLLGSEEG